MLIIVVVVVGCFRVCRSALWREFSLARPYAPQMGPSAGFCGYHKPTRHENWAAQRSVAVMQIRSVGDRSKGVCTVISCQQLFDDRFKVMTSFSTWQHFRRLHNVHDCPQPPFAAITLPPHAGAPISLPHLIPASLYPIYSVLSSRDHRNGLHRWDVLAPCKAVVTDRNQLVPNIHAKSPWGRLRRVLQIRTKSSTKLPVPNELYLVGKRRDWFNAQTFETRIFSNTTTFMPSDTSLSRGDRMIGAADGRLPIRDREVGYARTLSAGYVQRKRTTTVWQPNRATPGGFKVIVTPRCFSSLRPANVPTKAPTSGRTNVPTPDFSETLFNLELATGRPTDASSWLHCALCSHVPRIGLLRRARSPGHHELFSWDGTEVDLDWDWLAKLSGVRKAMIDGRAVDGCQIVDEVEEEYGWRMHGGDSG
ncbi:hypothetical protein G7K_6530-t1 [Saitoella complicata NRRL Y-17804]|uniref:Uncharacterized protein n=1 Tax=Saitoella complicata (strain BCRC 22490 / CBS 7301 / JCM 7358 / NBRC 10748 / NRRL Y-17804) TaxID=698492 RepID=A0A0E9NRH0_SAICN|nr:hypothetical protein G7K_6530-t1 [Saitoella complicata NRRL Y-17804]